MVTRNTYIIIGLLVVSIASNLALNAKLQNQINQIEKTNLVNQERIKLIEQKQNQLTEDNVNLSGNIDQVNHQVNEVTTQQAITGKLIEELNDKMMKRKK